MNENEVEYIRTILPPKNSIVIACKWKHKTILQSRFSVSPNNFRKILPQLFCCLIYLWLETYISSYSSVINKRHESLMPPKYNLLPLRNGKRSSQSEAKAVILIDESARKTQLHIVLVCRRRWDLLRVKFNKIRSVVAETSKIFSQTEARATIFVDESARNLHTKYSL